MKKWLLVTAFGLMSPVVFVVALDAYLHRPGRFCCRNYERIRVGMPLAEVEALLGAPGQEIAPEDFPLSPDFSQPVPWKQPKPVVNGDRFFRWVAPENYNGGAIIVGIKNGTVCDKWYWEERLSVHWAYATNC